MTKQELLERLRSVEDDLLSFKSLVKEYLGVKEEEYAELEQVTTIGLPFLFDPFSNFTEVKPVKKIRLVKVKKSKK